MQNKRKYMNKKFIYVQFLFFRRIEEIADSKTNFDITGHEWKTPQTLEIGFIEIVKRHTLFMHASKARNLEDAILWHFGKDENSKQEFMNLYKSERDTLIRFLQSL